MNIEMGMGLGMEMDMGMDTVTDMEKDLGMDSTRFEFQISYIGKKVQSDIRHNGSLHPLMPDIGGSVIRLSQLSFIMDSVLSAHLCSRTILQNWTLPVTDFSTRLEQCSEAPQGHLGPEPRSL
jgi:hypothetical protein